MNDLGDRREISYAETIQAALETPTPSPFDGSPINWTTLTPPAHQQALTELASWVNWLTNRYDLDKRTVPPCWSEHGSLIEELSALRTAWNLAYRRTSPPDAPLSWHNQYALARERLTDWTARTGCRTGNHRDPLMNPLPRSLPGSNEFD